MLAKNAFARGVHSQLSTMAEISRLTIPTTSPTPAPSGGGSAKCADQADAAASEQAAGGRPIGMQAHMAQVEAEAKAARARSAMERAFEEACVGGIDALLPLVPALPDPNDRHVVAAALKTAASVIVTDNLRDFPAEALEPLNLEVRGADAFIADTIALDPGRAVAAIRRMRETSRRPPPWSPARSIACKA